MVEDLQVAVGLDASGFTQGIGNITKSIGGLKGNLLGLGIVAGAAFAFKSAADLEESLLRIRANAREAIPDLSALGDEIFAVSQEIGKFSQAEVAAALAGIVNEADSAGEALQIVKEASKLAAISGADLADVSDQLTKVLSAYGREAADAAASAQVLFKVGKQTGTGVDELAQTMVRAAPLTKALGLSFEEAAALSGVLRDAGVESADSLLTAWTKAGGTGGLPRLLEDIQNAANSSANSVVDNSAKIAELAARKEELGQQLAVLNLKMGEFTDKTKESVRTAAAFNFSNLREEIVSVEKEIEALSAENGQVIAEADTVGAKLTAAFGKGGVAALALVQNAGSLQSALAAAKAPTDSLTLAVSENVSESDKAAVTFANLKTEIGQGLLPVVNAFLGLLANLFGWLQQNGLVDEFAAAIVSLATAFIAVKVALWAGAAGAALWGTTTATAGAAAAGGLTTAAAGAGAFSIAAAPITLTVLGITAAIAAGILIWKNWGDIVEWFKGVIGSVGPVVARVGDFIGDILKTVANSYAFLINIVVKAINVVLGAINKINVKVPDWIPEIGGKNFGFSIPLVPEVPMLDTGGLIDREGLAFLHAGEMVVPAAQVQPLQGDVGPRWSINQLHIHANTREGGVAAADGFGRELRRLGILG